VFGLEAGLDDETLGEEVRPMRDVGLRLRLDECLDKVLASVLGDEGTTVMMEVLCMARWSAILLYGLNERTRDIEIKSE
jgi:hypothetical protein